MRLAEEWKEKVEPDRRLEREDRRDGQNTRRRRQKGLVEDQKEKTEGTARRLEREDRRDCQKTEKRRQMRLAEDWKEM